MKTGKLILNEIPEQLAKFGCPNVVPIRDGQHEKDYDVIESQLDSSFISKLREARKASIIQNGSKVDEAAPVGFNQSEVDKYNCLIEWD